MRHRVFVDRIEPTVTVAGDEFHHAIRVVRARAGEAIELFDAAGNMARGSIARIEGNYAVIDVIEALPSRESKFAIDLAMAIINLDKFELVLQKATELGVRSIVPLITDRLEVRKERFAGKMDRWERIVFEAVKQSGRSVTPKLEEPQPFASVVARDGTKLLFDADAEPSSRPPELASALLFVGPEGGWSDEELQLAREHGCAFERLGPRRLRAETAAIVACALVAARYGDI
jgi:16S rRNA (uracil1498-N3)-methyltransferase